MQSACTSIDITKDSKHLLATSVDGVIIFNVKDGTTAASMSVPGNRKIQTGLSFGDKQFFLIYMDKKVTSIRIYNLADVLASARTPENAPKVFKEFTPVN